MLIELAATFRAVAAAPTPLAPATIDQLRALASQHAVVAAEGLELAADLRRAHARGSRGTAKDLALYQESVRLRLGTTSAGNYDLAVTALKAAEVARLLGKEKAFLEALSWALTCTEHDFPPRLAREALAQHFCRRGEYAKALHALGPLEGVGYPNLEFPAGLLVGAKRYRAAAALWEDLPEPFRSGEVLWKAWALHRAGEKKEAARVLDGALEMKGYFFGEPMLAEAKALAAFISGRSSKLPKGYHRVFGPIPHPQEHDTNLAVFNGVRPLRVASLAAKLHRLAHGDDTALADLLFAEARQRKTAGERHERAPYLTLLREGIAILDREKGPNDLGTLPHLRDLYWGTKDDEHRACARRYLAMTPTPDRTAVAMACELALHQAETDLAGAVALAQSWLQRCLDVGHRAWQLAYALAQLERKRGAHGAEAERLRQALELFDPEHYDVAGKTFELKMELEAACRAAGAPDFELEKELAAARAGWAAEWMKGRGAGRKKAISMLQPYLRPAARYAKAPFEAMDAAGRALGWRFLKMQINARPAHGELIEACRPHAAATTFSGYAASDLTIESLETKDTKEIRDAFVPTADDVVLLPDGRIYFWWD